ncbi:SCP2 sterol-binding domain-containing protein, partial [Actinosynnema sp. NPDC023926]
LGRWGARSPQLPHDAPISVDSLMLALHTLYDPHRYDHRAHGPSSHITLHFGRDTVHTTIRTDTLDLTRDPVHGHLPHRPDATVHTDTTTLNNIIQGRRDLTDARDTGDLTVHGDTDLAAHFVTLFPFSPAT